MKRPKPAVNVFGPLKYHGGKSYLAPRILRYFPRHLHYVEPCFGGGALLFARDPDDESFWVPPHKGVSEVVNDIDSNLINFWRTIRNPATFEQFRRSVEAMPMARVEWQDAHNHRLRDMDGVEAAVRFFVDCRQSRSGLMTSFTPITRARTRRKMNGNVSEWIGSVEGLPDVHGRLMRVLIENMDLIDLIPREDTKDTFFYVDPPYPRITRVSGDAYNHEMNDQQHRDLCRTLGGIAGKAMVSGRPCKTYDEAFQGWRRVDFISVNQASGSDVKKREVECIWMNYTVEEAGR